MQRAALEQVNAACSPQCLELTDHRPKGNHPNWLSWLLWLWPDTNSSQVRSNLDLNYSPPALRGRGGVGDASLAEVCFRGQAAEQKLYTSGCFNLTF